MPKEKVLTEPIALSCDTIGDLDKGIARHLVDAEIQKAIDDLIDRGEEDGKARVVAVSIELGVHNGIIYGNLSAQAKLPPRKSKSTAGKARMKAKGEHEFQFQPDNPERVDQPTFAADEDEAKE